MRIILIVFMKLFYTSQHVYEKKIQERYILVKDGDIHLHKLNATGSFLWEQLKNKKTKEELIESLMNKYSISKETATNDVRDFLAYLLKEKLVEQTS